MQIGISTASFFTKVATEDTFEYLKNFNSEVCEVFLSSFSEYEGELADKIVHNKSVDVYSVHTLTNQYEPELFSLNPRAASDSMNIFKKVLATGQRLGAKCYTFHGATRLKKINYNFDYDRLGGIVNNLIEIAGSYGIDLSYETVHWAYFSEPSYFENLKKRCPDLKATLDIKQIMQADGDYKDFLNVIGKDLTTVHLCDYDEERRLFIPGKGKFDFVQLFKRLLDNGFEGSCIMEVYPQGYQTFEQLKDSYDFLFDCYDKAKH